jgi:hypothetical protein
MRKSKAERNGASVGASIGASLGARGGPLSAGIGAGFGGAFGYLAGALSPCKKRSLLPDGGREMEGRGERFERGRGGEHGSAERDGSGVDIPVTDA